VAAADANSLVAAAAHDTNVVAGRPRLRAFRSMSFSRLSTEAASKCVLLAVSVPVVPGSACTTVAIPTL